jgi:ferredoxin
MNTRLFYFSGTGNSLAVARDIAKLLGDTDILPLTKAVKSGAGGPCENIGIVFPVYIWGMPLAVPGFLKVLKPSDAKYFFAVCTYGGFPAATLVETEKVLKAAGVKLSSGFAVRMPGNYTPMYGAIAEDKQKKMFAYEKEKVKEIAAAVREKRVSPPEKSGFLANLLFTGIIYKFSAPHMQEMDKKFFADEKCTSCGICARACPAKNIEIKEGKPQWQHRCYQCLACLQWCPVQAIQYGEATKKRKRYRHPDVKLEDFLIE